MILVPLGELTPKTSTSCDWKKWEFISVHQSGVCEQTALTARGFYPVCRPEGGASSSVLDSMEVPLVFEQRGMLFHQKTLI